MKYLLDQDEYDRLTGKNLTFSQWADNVMMDSKYYAFARQGKKQEEYLLRVYKLIEKAKELDENHQV